MFTYAYKFKCISMCSCVDAKMLTGKLNADLIIRWQPPVFRRFVYTLNQVSFASAKDRTNRPTKVSSWTFRVKTLEINNNNYNKNRMRET